MAYVRQRLIFRVVHVFTGVSRLVTGNHNVLFLYMAEQNLAPLPRPYNATFLVSCTSVNTGVQPEERHEHAVGRQPASGRRSQGFLQGHRAADRVRAPKERPRLHPGVQQRPGAPHQVPFPHLDLSIEKRPSGGLILILSSAVGHFFVFCFFSGLDLVFVCRTGGDRPGKGVPNGDEFN